MIEIIRIEKIKSKIWIEFSNSNSFPISSDLLLKYSLSKNLQIDEIMYELILQEQNLINAKQKAYNYASYKPRTEKQCRLKLKELEFNDKVIDSVIDFLYTFNFLNDENFAESFIKSRVERKNSSKNKVFMELIEKGVSKNLALDSIEKFYPKENELDLARKATIKKIRNVQNKNQDKQKNSIIAFLQRQGFNYDIIKQILKENGF